MDCFIHVGQGWRKLQQNLSAPCLHNSLGHREKKKIPCDQKKKRKNKDNKHKVKIDQPNGILNEIV